jgi:diguanylate cyclase (GGDEF)-like protein
MTVDDRNRSDDSIGRIDALVSLARSAREDAVDDVLRTVVETVHSTAGFENVVFNAYRPASDDYEVVLVIAPPDARRTLMHTTKDRELFEHELLSPRYAVHPGIFFVPGDAEAWNRLDDYVTPAAPVPTESGEWSPEDALLVELRDSAGGPLGVLSIDQPRSGWMPDLDDFRLLRAICSHAEQSLENAQASARAERHRSRLTRLLSGSAQLSASDNRDEVFEIARDVLVPHLGFERVAIYIRGNDQALSLAFANFDGVSLARTLERSLLAIFDDRTLATGGCWMSEAARVHGPTPGGVRSARNGRGRSGWSDDVLLVPAFDGDGFPRAVFAIEDPLDHLRPSEVECELVRLLVDHTETALERLIFRDQLEHLANHDPSTGLLNRRALAGISSATAAALVLCDLDHFKAVNDSYGHEIGDAVINRFADVLRSMLRKGDLAIRLGGDEFLVLLVGEDLESAHSVAERLLESTPVAMASLVPLVVTVSIGLTVIEKGEVFVDALRRADAALYAAKKVGRNRLATL